MTNRIVIEYSEDFRKNEIAGKVYGILRDNGFNPTIVNTAYIPKLGKIEVDYVFNETTKLPKNSDLEKMLKGINIQNIEIKK